MLKLGGFAVSNYYNKVKVALLEKGIPFEEEFRMTSQESEMLARSPMGKVPYLDIDGQHLCESQVICEYLEDHYPENPLYPKDVLERARVRELITVMELHLELVARRLYAQAFFGGTVSDEIKKHVEKDLAKGVRAFKQLARFSPFIAGADLTYADCAAGVHLPLVSLSSKVVYGRDVLEDCAPVRPYLKMLNERPAFRKMNDDRKAATEAMAAAARAKKG
jgi:glutathione S-transferase